MTDLDGRGCRITGATPAALDAYESALARYRSWRADADGALGVALREAPAFVMAHVLRAWLLVCSRDPRRVRSARPVLVRAGTLPANEPERLHLSAIAAALGDDYDSAKARLGEALRLQPRDLLALQVAHAFDYITGDMARMGDRVQAVLPAWSNDLPGCHAVLAMYAFSLGERGEYDRAEQAARAALALNPVDARAHHAMAHVFEMTGRADAGARWMVGHLDGWGRGSIVATHCWWHVALFHVAQGHLDHALELYDRRVRAGPSGEVADLIDSSALLWRIAMHEGDVGTRWAELADAWSSHIDDAFCSFNDVHAMLAFVGANDWDRAGRLEQALTRSRGLPTRYGATTRLVGLPACRALLAFGDGDDGLATTLLASLPPFASRLGGSQAQRDVLHLTRLRAIERMRGKARRPLSRAPRRPPVANHAT